MAGDKSQNINVNYRVNTSELDRLVAISRRAEEATNRITQASNQFSNRSSANNRTVIRDIDAMRTKMAQLKAQIELTDRADTKRIQALTSQYRSLRAEIDAHNKSLNNQSKEFRNLSGSIKGTSESLSDFYSGIRAVLTAGIVKEVVELSLSMADLAGNVDGVSRAFSRLPQSEALLIDLRRATHGTVTDLQLMQQAIRAQNFGIPLQQLSTYLEFAAIRAQQTGESVDYLVNSIVTGLGRDSIKILDNLQVNIAEMKKRMDEAGLSIDEAFAEQVQKQMQKVGGYVENVGTSASRLRVEFTQLKQAIAESVSGQNERNITFLSKTVDGLTRFVRNLKLEWYDLILVVRLYNRVAEAIRSAASERVREEAKILALQTAQNLQRQAQAMKEEERFDFIQQEINSRIQLIGRYNDEINKRKELIIEKQKGGVATADEVDKLAQEIVFWQNNKYVIEQTTEALKEYINTLLDQNNKTLPGIIEAQQKLVESLQEKVVTFRGPLSELKALERQLILAEAKLNDLKTLGEIKINLKVDEDLSSPKLEQKLVKPFVNAQGEIVRYEETVTNSIDNVNRAFLNYDAILERVANSLRILAQIKPEAPKFEIQSITFFDELAQEFVDNQNQIGAQTTDILGNYLATAEQIESDNYDRRLEKIRSFYDSQLELAGTNERAKQRLAIERDKKEEELRRKSFEREKKAQKEQALIHAAAAIVKVFLTASNYYEAIIQAALIAGETALQIDNINRARYAEGKVDIKGPGTSKSDSIPAMISRGESVINAEATARSKSLLEAINAKKIDDRIIKDLQISGGGVKYIGVSDDRVLTKLDELKKAFPDVVEQGSILWRVRQKNSTTKERSRAKWIN